MDTPAEPPILEYGLTTTPYPPRASTAAGDVAELTLTVVANLPDREDGPDSMLCDEIRISFDVGSLPCTDASYLTCADTGMTASGPYRSWTLASAEAGDFTFVRPPGVDPTVVTQGYAFEIAGIEVSPTVGTATVTVTETGRLTAAEPSLPRAITFKVRKFPATFREVHFRASRPAVPPGGTVSLSWTDGPGADYHLSVNGATPVEVSGGSWASGPLHESSSFELTVTTSSGTLSYGTDVLVTSEQVQLFGDKDLVLAGDPVTLSWVAVNVTDLTLITDAEGSMTKRTSVTADPATPLVVHPAAKTSYILEGHTRTGQLLQWPFTVTVLQRAGQAVSDLYLVTRSATTNTVHLQVASGSSGFTDLREASTALPASEFAQGSWSLCHCDTNHPGWRPDLVLVKTTGNSTPFVERHVAFHGSSGAEYSYVMRDQTPFPSAWGGSGTWLPVSKVGLVFIQTVGTPDGRVWVHTGTVGAVRIHSSVPTPCPVAGASSGTWTRGGVSGGPSGDDLVFIRTSGTASDKVELAWWTSSSGFQKGGVTVTGFDCDEAGSGTWHLSDMASADTADLVFVKTRETIGAVAEIYYATASSGFQHVQGGHTGVSLSRFAGAGIGLARYYHPQA